MRLDLSAPAAVAMDVLARGFADDVVRSYLRAETVEQADWHRTQGHELVIVSASLGMYLRPIAERLRFDAVLSTELEVGPDGIGNSEAYVRHIMEARARL
jgi:phosphatidylglycerophosphatase C